MFCMNTLIRISKVSKVYQKNKQKILDDIDLEVIENEFITILGHSGSGKSTLLRILALIDLHFDGSFEFEGKQIDKLSQSDLDNYRKYHASIIFQDSNLVMRHTIYRNLEFPLIIRQIPHHIRESMIVDVLGKVNLPTTLLQRFPSEISGGQRQRVAIARALLTNTKILIADEPTGSLDDENAVAIMKLFKSFKLTLIIATHDERIAKMSDRIIRIADGKIHVT